MPVHTNYKPVEILWFLRNYWKYDRNRLIEEYQRHFQDSSFGKSQYTWLRARYGMKEEWGAVLNHPPYNGALPGGTNTQFYEAPTIPNSAPRPSFRRPSEDRSPTLSASQDYPVPQSAFHFSASPNQTLLMPFTPQENDGADRASGLSSLPYVGLPTGSDLGSQMTPNLASNMALFSGPASIPGVNMNMGPMATTAPVPYGPSSSPPGRVSGSHHIYSFPLPYNTATSAAGDGQGMSSSLDMTMGANAGMGTQTFGYNMEQWGLGSQATFPQQQQQKQQQMPQQMPQQDFTMTRQFPAMVPSPMSAQAVVDMFYGPAPVMHENSMLPKPEAATASWAGPATTPGTGKRMRADMGAEIDVDIELRAPKKRHIQGTMSPGAAVSGLGTSVVAATLPSAGHSPQDSNTRGRRSKKKATPSRSTSIPEMQPLMAEDSRPVTSSPAVSAAGSQASSHAASQATTQVGSPTTPLVTSIDPRGEWFDGTHNSCAIHLRHRHDSSGGIYVVASQHVPSVEMSPVEQPETLPTGEPAAEQTPPRAETPIETVSDASFLYATPLSAADTGATDVDHAGLSPAVTTLFGSPVDDASVSPVLTMAPATTNEQPVATSSSPASASTFMSELDGVWDADLDTLWLSSLEPLVSSDDGLEAGPQPGPASPTSDATTAVPSGLPSPAPSGAGVSAFQLASSAPLGIGDTELGAFLSEIQA